jgi:hypothetical protein
MKRFHIICFWNKKDVTFFFRENKMLPQVLGDLCATYVGLHEVEILMSVSYKLTLPFTSVLEKQIHTCHPDMKYATLDWIPSALSMLRERKIANPVGHLYFFSRWYGHKQVENYLLQEQTTDLRSYRWFASLASKEEFQTVLERMLAIPEMRSIIQANINAVAANISARVKQCNLEELKNLLSQVGSDPFHAYQNVQNRIGKF